MSDSLIIDARSQLRWHRRFFSDASTAMLWGGWFLLWRPVVSGLAWLAGARVGLSPALLKLVAAGSPVSVEASAVALVSTSGSLLVWNMLTNRAPETSTPRLLSDYARHFNLSEDEIERGRAGQVCIVHHDEHGHITRIESREESQVVVTPEALRCVA